MCSGPSCPPLLESERAKSEVSQAILERRRSRHQIKFGSTVQWRSGSHMQVLIRGDRPVLESKKLYTAAEPRLCRQSNCVSATIPYPKHDTGNRWCLATLVQSRCSSCCFDRLMSCLLPCFFLVPLPVALLLSCYLVKWLDNGQPLLRRVPNNWNVPCPSWLVWYEWLFVVHLRRWGFNRQFREGCWGAVSTWQVIGWNPHFEPFEPSGSAFSF